MARRISIIGAAILACTVSFTTVSSARGAITELQDLPSATATKFEVANASWFTDKPDGFYMYIAGATRNVDLVEQRSRTMAYINKVKCEVCHTQGAMVIMCMGATRPKRIPERNFTFDPEMNDTRLKIGKSVIRWKGRYQPAHSTPHGVDPNSGARASVRLGRWATATGRVLDERFEGRRWVDSGYLTQGITSRVLLNTADGRIWIGRKGLVRYSYRFEIPR